MTDADVDLGALAARLQEQAQRLASDVHRAEHDVEALEAEPTPETALDPDFAEKLERSLAEPRERLQQIARSAK
ncbi:MAG TPA: hypothetical protein VK538_02715 [Solirubrobacteraceae bacterium]|jgi:hypothetical protein|nr:hypothetical protein [Solirubrobacteraceae bacterium]